MGKTSEKDNYNSYFAATLRDLLKESPKTGKKTTFKALGLILGVKQQSVSQWYNGATMPDSRHIFPIAEYFGVTTDYLLGMSKDKPPKEQEIQNVSDYTGLNINTVKLLHHIHNTEKSSESSFYLDLVGCCLVFFYFLLR